MEEVNYLKKFGIIAIIVLALAVLAGFVFLNGSEKKAAQQESAEIQNVEHQSDANCLDDCEKCPENIDGECTDTESDNVYIKDAGSNPHGHEKGSPECVELQKSGKCPGKCPHSQKTSSESADKI
jgi:hypothetical protein